jgi:hypothetical protein
MCVNKRNGTRGKGKASDDTRNHDRMPVKKGTGRDNRKALYNEYVVGLFTTSFVFSGTSSGISCSFFEAPL